MLHQLLTLLTQQPSRYATGLEASITDPDENEVRVKNAKILVESQDDAKLQVRVN